MTYNLQTISNSIMNDIDALDFCKLPELHYQHQLEGWETSDPYCGTCEDPPA